MKNIEINEFLARKLGSLIVVCKDVPRKGTFRMRTNLKANFRSEPLILSDSKKNHLVELSQGDSFEFVSDFIDTQLDQQLIVEAKRGTSYLLPNRHRRYYERCVFFSTNGLDIYFADKAIEKFSRVITKLERRSIGDSIHFAQRKLDSKEVYNMFLSISPGFPYSRGRRVDFQTNEGAIAFGPRNTLSYSVNLREDGTLHPEDEANLLELIDLFAISRGSFSHMEWTSKECVAYNMGSIKIVGTNYLPSLQEKVYRYVRRENEKFSITKEEN